MWEGAIRAHLVSSESDKCPKSGSGLSKHRGQDHEQRFKPLEVFNRVATLAEVESRRAKSLAAALAKERKEKKALQTKLTTLRKKTSTL